MPPAEHQHQPGSCSLDVPMVPPQAKLTVSPTFGIRADLTGCPVVPTGSSGSLRGVDCEIPHRRVRVVLLALLVVLVLTC